MGSFGTSLRGRNTSCFLLCYGKRSAGVSEAPDTKLVTVGDEDKLNQCDDGQDGKQQPGPTFVLE